MTMTAPACALAGEVSETTADTTIDDLRILTGEGAGDLLTAAFAPSSATVLSWRAGQVDHQPGRRSTVAYCATVEWPDGRTTQERLGACTGTPPPDTLVLHDSHDQVAVWRFPHDPGLPGLTAAFDETAIGEVLAALGLGKGPVQLQVRTYRPRRRAVIEATGSRGRVFVKVVRPSRVEALHERHRALVSAGVPAPQSLGWTPDGLLVLETLNGRTLRQALRVGVASLPPGEALLTLLDRLPETLTQGDRRASWLERVPHYAAVVAAVLPDVAERAHRLSEAIVAEAGTGPIVATHGDFYESQLLVERNRISGLLDVDTAGPGERLDDLACMLGHLSVLAQIDRVRAGEINRLGARYLAAFERTVDPADLRYRVAAVVISLATGPHRVQEHHWQQNTARRLDLAEQWLHNARRLRDGGDEKALIPTSADSHTPAACS